MSDDRDWLDELYAEGRDEAPPPALDAVILAAARENATRPWYRNLRYLTTVATAASFVLAAMVVYLAPDDESFVTPRPPAAVPARERQPPGKTSADQPVVDQQREQALGTTLEEAMPESPAEPAAQNDPFAAGRTALSNEAAKRLERTASAPAHLDLVTDNMERSAEAESDRMEALAGLTIQCGPPPGSDDTRTLQRDALGWYLTVITDQTLTYYRCDEGAWQMIDGPATAPSASEQEPDPENDE